MFCGVCKKIHHELPDNIVPYKRHCAETIEKITKGNTDVPCESKTVQRIYAWWSTVVSYFMNILKALTEKYNIPFKSPPAFREVIRAIGNTNNWIFAHQICTRSVSLPDGRRDTLLP